MPPFVEKEPLLVTKRTSISRFDPLFDHPITTLNHSCNERKWEIKGSPTYLEKNKSQIAYFHNNIVLFARNLWSWPDHSLSHQVINTTSPFLLVLFSPPTCRWRIDGILKSYLNIPIRCLCSIYNYSSLPRTWAGQWTSLQFVALVVVGPPPLKISKDTPILCKLTRKG